MISHPHASINTNNGNTAFIIPSVLIRPPRMEPAPTWPAPPRCHHPLPIPGVIKLILSHNQKSLVVLQGHRGLRLAQFVGEFVAKLLRGPFSREALFNPLLEPFLRSR